MVLPGRFQEPFCLIPVTTGTDMSRSDDNAQTHAGVTTEQRRRLSETSDEPIETTAGDLPFTPRVSDLELALNTWALAQILFRRVHHSGPSHSRSFLRRVGPARSGLQRLLATAPDTAVDLEGRNNRLSWVRLVQA